MAQEIINIGAFDDDPSAERIRQSFAKSVSNFAELYARTDSVNDLDGYLLTGGYPGTAADLKDLIDGIAQILASNDTNLDIVQELVDFMKMNESSITMLQSILVSNDTEFDTLQELVDAIKDTVRLSGDQSIDDVKTFTSSPIVPIPTTDFQAVPKKYLDDNFMAIDGAVATNLDYVASPNSGSILSDTGVDAIVNAANQFLAGVMTASDFLKLRDIEYNAQRNKYYVHDQPIPSMNWNVSHNMNTFPSVTLVSTLGKVVEADITYVDSNNIIIIYSEPFAGKAYLN